MKFPLAIGQSLARNKLLAQAASPQVLLVAGTVGMVGSTVLACRATLKMDALMGEAKEKLEMARTLEHPEYSEEDRQRDISLIYFQTGVKIVRTYTPAIIVGAAGIAALVGSNRILMRRNTALIAAYTALDEGFRKYRERVVAKYGEDEDRNLRYGSQQVEIVNPETNRKKTVTRVGPGEPSIYARFFDSSSSSWNKEPEYNLLFLHAQQNYYNDLLKSRGHVFLNEVYEQLGIPHSKAGAVVGWIRSEDGSTDNFINFGVFDDREVVRDFVNGFEGSILLDFNVDGVIYDKMEE